MRGPADRLLRRVLHPAYRSLETTVHPLRYLFLEITQRCNLSCLHCGSDCTRDQQLDELSTAEWLRVLDHVADRFPSGSLALVLTGGEPFCRPELDEFLRRIRQHGLPWGLVTNGWALTAANVARVRDHGLMSMTISLDGLAASHDWLRGAAGAFERALAGIRHVVQASPPLFDVVTCVNPRNLGELDRVLALLRAEGVPAWRLFTIFPRGRARGNPELLLGDDQLRALLAWIAARRRELAGQDFRLDLSCEGYLPAALDRQVRDEPYFCRAGISIGSVLCDGTICACPNVSRQLAQGNVRTDDLHDVWENRFQAFRDRAWMRRGPCTDCAEWRRCHGNSMHLYDDEAGHTGVCTFEAVGAGR